MPLCIVYRDCIVQFIQFSLSSAVGPGRGRGCSPLSQGLVVAPCTLLLSYSMYSVQYVQYYCTVCTYMCIRSTYILSQPCVSRRLVDKSWMLGLVWGVRSGECMYVLGFVCLSVCLFVCLLEGLGRLVSI